MIFRFFLAVFLIASLEARGQGIGNLDLITQTNGDIHNGTLASEVFTLETPYGSVSIPYSQTKFLQRRTINDQMVLTLITREGERYSGQLADRAFTVLRPDEPPITVSQDDIAEVEFGERPSLAKKAYPPHAFQMTNGDLFRGRLLTGTFMVKSGMGLKTEERENIQAIDIHLRSDTPLPMARLFHHASAQGEIGHLLNGTLSLQTSFGQSIAVKTTTVSTLSLTNNDLSFPSPFPAVPHQSFRDPMKSGGLGPELVLLKGGTYDQGDLSGGGDNDEKPVRKINLVNPFAMGKFEVTFDEYDRFCRATGRDYPEDSGWGRGTRPVINVSWEDAVAYTQWLSEETGRRYRLPSDSEWEFAARGGTQSRYWWGARAGQDKANCAGCGSLWDAERTAPVGKFPANPFGLNDTAGNVFEWAADCYHDTFEQAPRDGRPLEKAAGCGKRVIRGGAWSFPPKEVRSANRWRDFPTRSSDDTGFRVLRELP